MLTCGNYERSGDICYPVGLPAKSGVAAASLPCPRPRQHRVCRRAQPLCAIRKKGTQAMARLAREMGWSIFYRPASFCQINSGGKRPRAAGGCPLSQKAKRAQHSCSAPFLSINSEYGLANLDVARPINARNQQMIQSGWTICGSAQPFFLVVVIGSVPCRNKHVFGPWRLK